MQASISNQIGVGAIVTPKQTQIGSMIPEREGQRGVVGSRVYPCGKHESIVAWFNGGTTICLTRSLKRVG